MTPEATVISAAVEVQGADAAFNQPPRLAPRTGDGNRRRVGGDNESGKQTELSEGCHGQDHTPGGLAVATLPGLASYLDGHFAITPFGSTSNPDGDSVPFSTTSASSLKVSGTMPV